MKNTTHKWPVLILIGLTATLVIAMPSMAIPVLFSEIAEDLGLSLLQIGAVWGAGSLAGVVTALAVGVIGDRFGARRVLAIGCLGLGLTGSLRGFSNSFAILAATTLLSGFLASVVPMTLHKACGLWFSGKHLGLANGVVSAGMATGFMTGAMISATVLSPWLGGWRLVMFFYGGIAVLMSIPWAFLRPGPDEDRTSDGAGVTISMRKALSHVVRIRNVWLLGLAFLGVGGCIQSMLGYLPLFLREVEWLPARADAALASFHAISLAAVFPITLLSDRLGSRKIFLVLAALMVAVGVGLLGIVSGGLVWIAVMTAGVVRDGFMAILMTMVIELEGVGPRYAGTAIGLSLTLGRLGELLMPPIGNSLASLDLQLPFLFWAFLAFLGCITFFGIKERKI
jgi:NNP family nitrate/nitrite transporter-like MFS transporter